MDRMGSLASLLIFCCLSVQHGVIPLPRFFDKPWSSRRMNKDIGMSGFENAGQDGSRFGLIYFLDAKDLPMCIISLLQNRYEM